MNKTQLAAAVAEKAGVSKADAATYVNMVLGAIADNICEGDGEVSIPASTPGYESTDKGEDNYRSA